MMSTQPDVSAAGVLATLVSTSALRLPIMDFAARSSVGLPLNELDRIILAVGVFVDVTGEKGISVFELFVELAVLMAFGRLVMLPIRNRGTRVWIFCSSILTRARISVTICTPLLFDAVAGIALAELEVDESKLRVASVCCVTGDRGRIREDVDKEGSVLERAIEDGLKLVAVGVLPGLNPERWRRAD